MSLHIINACHCKLWKQSWWLVNPKNSAKYEKQASLRLYCLHKLLVCACVLDIDGLNSRKVGGQLLSSFQDVNKLPDFIAADGANDAASKLSENVAGRHLRSGHHWCFINIFNQSIKFILRGAIIQSPWENRILDHTVSQRRSIFYLILIYDIY